MTGRRQPNGFTLLEMLVAMMLMSILAGALYAGMHTAFAGRRRTEADLEPVERAAAAMWMIQASLEAATPPTGILAAEFLGDDAAGLGALPADAVAFYALARDQGQFRLASPVHRIEISLGADEETGELVLLRRTTANLLAPETQDPVEEVLCRRVLSLETAFYDGSAWQDTWDSTAAGDVLPMAVEIRLVLAAAGHVDGYAVTRVFALPCATLPGESGARGGGGGDGAGGGGFGGGAQ